MSEPSMPPSMTPGGSPVAPPVAARVPAPHGVASLRNPFARLFVRLYAALHGLAERGWAATAVGGWGFLQASVVPGPVDTLLVPLGIADPPRAYRFAWAAVIGGVLGTLVGYAAGALAYDTIGVWALDVFGVEGAEIEVWRARFQRQGWWVVFLSIFTPVSVKLVSVAAGTFGVPLWQFLLAIFAGRTLRFMVVAFAVRRFGTVIEGWVLRRYGVTLDELARGSRRGAGGAAGGA